ncbi:dTDP-4-dehydrorhamnose reductase [Rhizobium sp. BK376]|uniref:dTDP-4-dehydrorhamnose reductase n=1 Tax=Rhizobium sp. BK376 TaxID=2512149 RepID=UPI00104CEE2A|nr:dTDP-4-dehydrorhamnose reductase [Rhizobium sp. BK376]TCR71853.1 dTDP-4-dehydrorhamnose reductase [Rhizobium sp. BK376]
MGVGIRKRLVVTGLQGQVVRCLADRGTLSGMFEVIALGRPCLDLSQPETIFRAIEASTPDVLISAAAYTAVDQAEAEPALAQQINGTAAGKLAKSAAELNVPIIHLSTDYVFDGNKDGPYVETDPVAPLGVYGRSKLSGEEAVAAATYNHAILRTAWVYSPYGKNFLKTMLRLAETRDTINVVADQIGNPTSAEDIADGLLTVAGNLLERSDEALRGTFHIAGAGNASWAEFAAEIFANARALGAPFAEVLPIPSSAYPTPTKRPANSQLDCDKLAAAHGVRLPAWQASTAKVVAKLLSKCP